MSGRRFLRVTRPDGLIEVRAYADGDDSANAEVVAVGLTDAEAADLLARLGEEARSDDTEDHRP